MSARFCSQCGGPLREESKFCASCGAPVSLAGMSAPADTGAPPAPPAPAGWAPPPAAPVAAVPGSAAQFYVKGNGITKTHLVIADGVLTQVVDAIPIALARKFRLGWALGYLVFALADLMAIGSLPARDPLIGVLTLLLFAPLIVIPAIYWFGVRPNHRVFTVTTPLTSIQEVTVGSQNTALGCLLFLFFGIFGLLYFLFTTSKKAVVVKAPFMFGPDGTSKLTFHCSTETEAVLLMQALLRR